MSTTNSATAAQSAIETLAGTSLRVTAPRKRLIHLLAEAEHPLSVEEIHSLSNEEMDIVTIYRNIAVFVEHKVVQAIPMENGKQLFELARIDEHYHHIICRVCHSSERMELCFGKELETYARSKGFSQLHHLIEVFGLCNKCESKHKNQKDSL